MTPTFSQSRGTASRARVIAAVNSLLADETGSIMERLREAEPYIPATAADEAFAVQELVDEDARHAEQLVHLLDRLRATPGPRCVNIDTGDLHYNRLHALLPRLIADQQRLISRYEAAQSVVVEEPAAADVVGAVLNSHRAHLARLEKLAAAAKAGS
ncbi:MAG TPA: hypothetical protein P5572_05505 [Phycisphaerae bacterium]|nr:hypothetical protein [Phycisphaerales bacterium]HRX84459.1 hypothetical protein [Phycisphaerae bacterium]